MPETSWGFEIEAEEFESWVRQETVDWVCLDKPPMVVCHPSKRGPRSSLVGAFRLFRQLDSGHLIFRIDRETSGVVLIAKNRETASLLQRAVERRNVHKEYIAILCGELREKVVVDVPLGRDMESPIVAKQAVRPDGKEARTLFEPLATAGGYSLVRVGMTTGRQHQIRAHAEWMKHPVVGDKMYGVPPEIFLTFIEEGWTDLHTGALAHRRQALHALRVVFELPGGDLELEAPLESDLVSFTREHMGPVDAVRLISQLDSGPDRR